MMWEKMCEKLRSKNGTATRQPRQQEQEQQLRSVFLLHLVRGSYSMIFRPPSAAAAAAAAAAGGPRVIRVDARVGGKLPDEMIWEVVRFAPPAKLAQWQLVSRKWRRELTSAHFRNRLRETWVQQLRRQEEQSNGGGGVACPRSWPCVVARSCGWPCDVAHASSSSPSSWSDGEKTLEVDVSSLVPSGFWQPWEERRCHVAAAAHGLVCISNDSEARPRYCVLNPLTRKCVALPPLPLPKPPDRWCLPAATTGAGSGPAAGAVTIWGFCDKARTAWVVATYDLTAAAAAGAQSRQTEWVVGHKLAGVPTWALAPDTWSRAPAYAVLGRESYWYSCNTSRMCTDRLHVLAAAPGGEVEVGALDGHKVWETQQHEEEEQQQQQQGLEGVEAPVWERDEWGPYFVGPVVFPDRGAVFLVSDLWSQFDESRWMGIGLWRLVRERMEWEQVELALLDGAGLARLTGVLSRRSYPHLHPDACRSVKIEVLYHAYPLRQLVCCNVSASVRAGAGGSIFLHWFHCLVGFNLDTGEWELVRNERDWEAVDQDSDCEQAMEIRPDTVLDWTSQSSLEGDST